MTKYYLIKLDDNEIIGDKRWFNGATKKFYGNKAVELTPKELCMIYDLINDKWGNKEWDTLIEKWRKI